MAPMGFRTQEYILQSYVDTEATATVGSGYGVQRASLP